MFLNFTENEIENAINSKEYMEMKNVFTNKESMDKLEEIVSELKNYDIFDIIARISGLNILSENQNKSILLDFLIAKILCKEESVYSSIHKMSDGKFKKIIENLNTTNLRLAVDPNENVFIQNIMMGENYRIFNGIDQTPSYNLQTLIDILFLYKNSYPAAYLIKVRRLFLLVLWMSEEIAKKFDITLDNAVNDENRLIIVPDGKRVHEYAASVIYPEYVVKDFLGKDFDISELLTTFNTKSSENINYQPFYVRPFIYNAKEKTIILLNVSLLSTFAFYKALDIADLFKIKEEIINRYNDLIWHKCQKSLKGLGHQKILEDKMGLKLRITPYYKEMLVTALGNQLMLVIFVCDDAYAYNERTMHEDYPDKRHSEMVEKRIAYFIGKVTENKLDKYISFCLLIVSGFGRGIAIKSYQRPSFYKILKLNPFELHCINILESKRTDFLPRYIRAKEKINTTMPEVFSELNAVSIYTSNRYSFYMSDDFEPSTTNFYIAPGDSVDYICKALKRENKILISSYFDGYKTEVICLDKTRNIYIEDRIFDSNYIAFCLFFDNCNIWITSEKPEEYLGLNLCLSILDMISYWISECKDIIERMSLYYISYRIHIILTGNSNDYYLERKEECPFRNCLHFEVNGSCIQIKWNAQAYGQLNQSDNHRENELCELILDIINGLSFEPLEYVNDISAIFKNPLKKKFFSLDPETRPYLKPVKYNNKRYIHIEDEDYLSDVIGVELLKTGEWSYGVIPNKDRNKITQAVVGLLYNLLQKEIAQFSSENLIEMIYHDLEETLYNLLLAERRYASELACYPEKEKEFLHDYNELNRTSLALKFMLEYVAAQPPKGLKFMGIGEYEYILAICSLIIEWAYKGDLFNYNIFNTKVEILPSNRVGMEQNSFINMYQYGMKFRREKLCYNLPQNYKEENSIRQEDYANDLNAAFFSEFGYIFDDFIRVIYIMIIYTSNKDEDVFIENKNSFISSLAKFDPTLSVDLIYRVIDDITIKAREDFLIPPNGYTKLDIYPWRFNRKYSFIRKPVVLRNDDLIWGNRQLYHMVEYVTHLIFEGQFPASSKEMKSLLGIISHDRGNKFNKFVVELLEDMHVFGVKPNVKKINKKNISDENGNTLGDIDILIIDEERKKIYATEVKDFNFSRNPYEIQMEYEKLFVDSPKKKSYVTKHQRRVEWLKLHMEDVITYYGLSYAKWEIIGIFIVSEPLISKDIYGKEIEIISVNELNVERLRKI